MINQLRSQRKLNSIAHSTNFDAALRKLRCDITEY